ncbi:MAG: flagellar biosynthetic protein FliR [Alphaproteobacteria bacterium]|nr:flagellar biosynthetic protein FliR [Alphaproteobacteria bacterium]
MPSWLEQLLVGQLFHFILVFARIGTAFTFMTGFGESFVLARARLVIALGTALVMTPVIAPSLPPMPAGPLDLAVLLIGEILVGIVFGTATRLVMSALELAGTLVAFQSGLASATVFNPMISTQGALPSVYLAVMAMVLMFQTDLHHLTIRALAATYGVLTPGQLPPVGDFTEFVVRLIGEAFLIGVQISSPFLILITVMYVGVGLVSRLMPQIQIFFITLPLQIGLGLLLLVLVSSSMMLVFLEYYATVISSMFAPR